MRKHQKGVAMALALFLVAGLEVVIANSMLATMRHQRVFQKQIEHPKLIWAIEAISDRTFQLFEEYVAVEGKFPNVDANNYVLGNDSSVTGNQTFSNFIASWYADFQSRYSDILNNIEVNPPDVRIENVESTAEGERYDISVTLKVPGSGIETTVSQRVLVKQTKSNLFDYSVFYNEDLEIAPQEDVNFEVQGPIFSNGDIYVDAAKYQYNDEANPIRSNTVTFLGASDQDSSSQPYVVRSAGNFYIGPKRFVGRNYLLDNDVYRAAVPDYYINMPGELEVSPDMDLGEGANPRFVPRVYNITNIPDRFGDKRAFRPDIQIEDSDGSLISLTTHIDLAQTYLNILSRMEYFGRNRANDWRSYYTFGYSEPSNTYPISLSSAFDLTDTSTWINKPLPHPYWASLPNLIEDNANISSPDLKHPKQYLNFGIPTDPDINPSGLHALIEPLTGTPENPSGFPVGDTRTRAQVWDTPELVQAKIQSQADFVLYTSSQKGQSPDLKEWGGIQSDRIIKGMGIFNNIRETRSNIQQAFYIDLNTILTLRPQTRIIYVVVNASNMLLLIANGQRLPKEGLTIATNGRLFIEGDYNTFSYQKETTAGGFCSEIPWSLNASGSGTYDPNCYITDDEWDAETCLTNGTCAPPPALIASDSVGVVSYVWNLDYTDLDYSTGPAMVNAALITGTLPSFIYPRLTCEDDMSNCYFFKQQPWGWLASPLVPTFFECADQSYVDGRSGVSNTCQYYREEPAAGVFHYYVNPKSDFYQGQISQTYGNVPYMDYPSCDPTITVTSDPAHCDQVRIPIFVDANDHTQAVAPMFGINFKYLERDSMNDFGCRSMICQDGSVPRLINGSGWSTTYWGCENMEPVQNSCNFPPPAGETPRYQKWLYQYHHPKYEDLYNGHYSGGLENIINFSGEIWKGSNLRYSGSILVPYEAIELKYGDRSDFADGSMLYYGVDATHPNTPSRFTPPNIQFDYNETLKTNPPPGFGSRTSIKRERWREV